MQTKLLSDIDAFLQETGIAEGYFGWKSARNWRLMERLRAGRRIWPETEAEIRAFMISTRRAPVSETKRTGTAA
jgi:hypothetical protein